MSAPRLEIDLDKIRHNATALVALFAERNISVTGVTKAFLGCPEVARAMLASGVSGVGDSRIENLRKMRNAGITAQMTLIRSPMLSQVEEVVATADISLNTELAVIRALSVEANRTKRNHGIVLMVELGDLREGFMPKDMAEAVRETLDLPGIYLEGIGTNLACQSGVVPDAQNMGELSTLADALEDEFGVALNTVSGGNSGNIPWFLSGDPTGRTNNLRLGESILLGCEPLHRQPIDGLYTDSVQLVAEVIEIKEKPSCSWGEQAETAFGEKVLNEDEGHITQAILAIGQQDIDPGGLGFPDGITLRGASSDHLVVNAAGKRLVVGEEVAFSLNYSALLRATTSPFVTKVTHRKSEVLGLSAAPVVVDLGIPIIHVMEPTLPLAG